MRRRDKVLLGFSACALTGTALLVGAAAWFLWNKSIEVEERAIAELATTLGRQTERIIVDARNMLQELNGLSVKPCSDAHLDTMGRMAFTKPHVLAIGYWQASKRLCGAGFTQAIQLKPPEADRIYEEGIIAWWPGPQTEVEGVELFLMRYGRYDVALDPRTLIQAVPTHGRQVGLWLEGLSMATAPGDADLPPPGDISRGLGIDRREGRLLARFSLDTIFPIDIVVAEPIDRFWARYWPTIMITGAILLGLSVLWIYTVLYYMRRRLSLATELHESLSAGEITAQYQPIMDLATGKCVGAEALARWARESGEIASPDAFITAAEDAGLASRITLAVLDEILNDLGLFLRRQPDMKINLNLAPESLNDNEFASILNRRVHAEGVPPESIKLEITERTLINSDNAHGVINHLRGQGHEVAVDDFGTGYSSLAYLQSFALDMLKIDKLFVDTIGTEAVTSHVVLHIIELAKDLDLDIVAEGVETEEQASWLRAHGVRYAQGYLFSKPLAARAFQQFYRTNLGFNVYTMDKIVQHGGAQQ